jgi:DTW domain-containing protein YfiP
LARGPIDLSRRCARCLFPADECLCAEIPRVATRTRFVVVRHASELPRPTNSARWAALAMPALTVVDYALPGTPIELAPLLEPDAVLLFPSPHAPRLDPLPRQVIVVDATWAQARRMVQRLPELRSLPRLSIPAEAPSRLDAMRRSRVAGRRSTLEAIADALELLGEADAARALAQLHDAAMARAWRLRTGGAGRRSAA